MICIRNLVAVELAFLGPKFILAEYAFAVVAGVGLGVLSLRVGLMRTHAMWQVLVRILCCWRLPTPCWCAVLRRWSTAG